MTPLHPELRDLLVKKLKVSNDTLLKYEKIQTRLFYLHYSTREQLINPQGAPTLLKKEGIKLREEADILLDEKKRGKYKKIVKKWVESQ
ncbi:MAG: hypothetical protein D8M58_18475 [Calditrichaeota bacterium]|nr:MAG: hypothetical protein DWQ03_11705 [Calditrichota bacterium]MBL1207396.1 hypothetical protein [Calditrichota bacterium]NOG47228.1 hypothetical protein [Calditrichota bacterium]